MSTRAGDGSSIRALRGGRRWLRIVALGSASLILATTAHLAGGGMMPGPGVLISLAVVLGAVAAVLTGRRLRLPGLLVLLGLEQAALHWALEVAGRAACLPVVSAAGAGVPMTGHAGLDPHATTAAVCAQAMDGHVGIPMLLAHGAATVLTAWLLARGEAALWRLTERVVRAAAPVVSGLTRPTVSVRPLTTVRRAACRRPAATHPPRGPPPLPAAC